MAAGCAAARTQIRSSSSWSSSVAAQPDQSRAQRAAWRGRRPSKNLINDPRHLLLVGPAQSYRFDAFLAAARRLGVRASLATDLPGAFASRGLTVHPMRFGELEASAAELTAALRTDPPDGLMPTNEASAVVAALVARDLGLPHVDPDGAMAALDKRRMRDRLAAAGVPCPRCLVLSPDGSVDEIASQLRFPCVVKPPMLTGSQGVIRADDRAGLDRAVARVRSILSRHPSELSALREFGHVLVEDYLPGVEVTVEGLVVDGALTTLAIFDKPDPLVGPFFEETLYVTPSRLPPAVITNVVDVAAQAAAALGLRTGPIHAELRVDEGRAAVVEIAARSIGGSCSRSLARCIGPLEDLLVAHAVGLPFVVPEARGTAAGVMMLPIPRSGVLRGVSGIDAARAVPGIVDLEIAVAAGQSIRALPEGSSYLGFVFAEGPTPDSVERALREAHSLLGFDLTPLFDVV